MHKVNEPQSNQSKRFRSWSQQVFVAELDAEELSLAGGSEAVPQQLSGVWFRSFKAEEWSSEVLFFAQQLVVFLSIMIGYQTILRDHR